MMKIGIIGPSEEEIMPFVGKIEDISQHKYAMLNYYTGRFDGTEVVAVFSGVCKVNAAIATQVMIDKFDVTHIILTGVAGALRDDLHIGDIVIGSEIAYHDMACEILTEYHPWMEDIYFKADREMIEKCIEISKTSVKQHKCYTGRIITGEAFITEKERNKLIAAFSPLCVDMESASVAHTCFVNNIPFVVIRSMSDTAGEDGLKTFENNVESVSLNSLQMVEELIKRYK